MNRAHSRSPKNLTFPNRGRKLVQAMTNRACLQLEMTLRAAKARLPAGGARTARAMTSSRTRPPVERLAAPLHVGSHLSRSFQGACGAITAPEAKISQSLDDRRATVPKTRFASRMPRQASRLTPRKVSPLASNAYRTRHPTLDPYRPPCDAEGVSTRADAFATQLDDAAGANSAPSAIQRSDQQTRASSSKTKRAPKAPTEVVYRFAVRRQPGCAVTRLMG